MLFFPLLLTRDSAPVFSHRIFLFAIQKGSIFISAGTMGAFGFVFSDFGKAFSVRDVNGEAPTSRIITDVREKNSNCFYMLYMLCMAGSFFSKLRVHSQNRL